MTALEAMYDYEDGTMRQRQHLRRLVALKKTQVGCVDCGYRAAPEALDFDHLPGADKVSTIGRMVWDLRPWQEIQAEMQKCEVRCSNCHRIVTQQRRRAK